MVDLYSYELELNPARKGSAAFTVEGNLRDVLERRIYAADAPDHETGETRQPLDEDEWRGLAYEMGLDDDEAEAWIEDLASWLEPPI